MNASCDPQSGQAPMKSCSGPPARSAAVASGPPSPPIASRTGAAAAGPPGPPAPPGPAPGPPRRSCWVPCFPCIHFSIAIPIASGTQSTWVGTRRLRPPLKVLRFGVVQLVAGPRELGLELGDPPQRLRQRVLAQPRGLLLHLLRGRAGG